MRRLVRGLIQITSAAIKMRLRFLDCREARVAQQRPAQLRNNKPRAQVALGYASPATAGLFLCAASCRSVRKAVGRVSYSIQTADVHVAYQTSLVSASLWTFYRVCLKGRGGKMSTPSEDACFLNHRHVRRGGVQGNCDRIWDDGQ